MAIRSCVYILLIIIGCIGVVLSKDSAKFSNNETRFDEFNLTDVCHAPEGKHFNGTTVNDTLLCFGNISRDKEKTINIKHLILCGWIGSSIDPLKDLQPFQHNIVSLRIENSSYLTRINHDFPEMKFLELINITRTQLKYIRPTLFKKLLSLKELDLRWNQLKVMDTPLRLANTFHKIWLADNPWNCSNTSIFKWLVTNDKSKNVEDRAVMKCDNRMFPGRLVMNVMKYQLNLQNDCDRNGLKLCVCTLTYLRPSEDGLSLVPMYSVNCSKLGLTQLPQYLPVNTTTLIMSHNQITSLEPLKNNSVYGEVKNVHLDHNLISSVDILEDTTWLRNFQVFNLKANKLSRLPSYALDNALKKNHGIGQLYLSQNPWRCDCLFAPRFQRLLMEFETVIKDSKSVRCKYHEGDENIGVQVLTIKLADVCKVSSPHGFQPLDILNVVLATLIVLLMAKLSYDYYNYRKYGKLPWIVMKVPFI